ncbi:MAG: tetratricopeptide repeat protein [Bacteroidetes bacterium]|nr:tetratricopeptide repeat protein [Bacteroidota bacterium]
MKNVILIFILMISVMQVNAQMADYYLKKGNEKYKAKEYEEARKKYVHAAENDGKSPLVSYNFGNALYQQKNYNGASEKFEAAANNSTDKSTKAKAFYNLGNANLKAKKNDMAIKYYKESLKLNPTDAEAKYNLSYALRKKKQSEQEKPKDDKKNQKQNNKPKEDKNKEKQQPKSGDDEVKKLLDALKNEEEKVHKRLRNNNGEPQKQKGGKEW